MIRLAEAVLSSANWRLVCVYSWSLRFCAALDPLGMAYQCVIVLL
jgi:hypothetical protein